jgi:Clp amino terminal domain, pathogenicity island component
MAEFPVPLDNLIAFVKALHPDGGPLGNVSDAMVVSAQLDEQSDALIGYFVDQARRSGASWSQIGASMGVSKQAAQKRFVPRWLVPEGQGRFSRFTPRARNVLAAAGRLAGAEPVSAAHLTAGLLTEPEGLGAKVIARAGLTGEQLVAAVGAGPAAAAPGADLAALQELSFTADGKGALKGTLKAALRLGHNYIGTEHLLLGVLAADGRAGQALATAGLDRETAEQLLASEFAELQAGARQADQPRA